MDSQEVRVWLEQCLEAASHKQPDQASTEQEQEEEQARRRQNYCSTREALCAELSSLLQEALEMRWPFVPERWQYKETLSSQDKTNLSDLISHNLPQLMALLKAAILWGEVGVALAVVFLVDRLLYWSDESHRLLSITKLLHRRQHGTPVAPQLVIRQARVYLNTGKLQKAEFILSSLIINNGATGSWTYQSESDKLLVQAVSVQVRGLVLQKLGLWLEAAELIWASLIGFFALPQPDKKGIGTSLGVFANILVSMNDEDFEALKNNPDIDLSLLADGSQQRLLYAAAAAKLAVVFSQYASLYVLTNVVAQGTCLLSHSFSLACDPADRHRFLLQAKQAFEIGLLTKTEDELASSKQELHTFLKAAYSLAVTHRWLGLLAADADEAELSQATEAELNQATQACRDALVHFYDYCRADAEERDGLAADIMRRVGRVKRALGVAPYPNSDAGSFVPDFYRKGAEEERHEAAFTPAGFFHLMQRFRKYHKSICESMGGGCTKGGGGSGGSSWHNVSSVGSSPAGSGGNSPSSSSVSGSEAYKMVEAAIDTESSEEDDGPVRPLASATGQMSRLNLASSFGSSLGSSFGSLGSSFSSRSWEKISPVPPPFRSGLRASPDAPTPFTHQHPGPSKLPPTKPPTSYEELETKDWDVPLPPAPAPAPASAPDRQTSDASGSETKNPACRNCREPGALASPPPGQQYALTERDYRALLAGVCHDCLLRRLQSKETKFKLKEHKKAYDGLQLKFSRATGLWTCRETCVYIGELTGMEGKQRNALWVQFLHQEERLSSYMGKDYKEPKQMQFHLRDVERQMTSQYYVTQFNKKLYEQKITAQIFFLPSDVLLLVEAGAVVGVLTVEPFMLGDFVKLTNNTGKKDSRFPATEYGIAFGHFTYLFSRGQEVVVDLQGVVAAKGKGLTYLTDPQIHSTRYPRDPSNFGERGLRYFLDEQHGPECNDVCRGLNLPAVTERRPPTCPRQEAPLC